MFKITILALGKVKKDYYRDALAEYLKMISPYAMIRMEELSPESFYENSDKEKIKEKEGLKIAKYLEKFPDSKIIILDERGKGLGSEAFSQMIAANQAEHIIFVVGGTLGMSKDVLNYKNAVKLSLSPMTFPHEMARVILAEQIYRAIAIGKNKSYHY